MAKRVERPDTTEGVRATARPWRPGAGGTILGRFGELVANVCGYTTGAHDGLVKGEEYNERARLNAELICAAVNSHIQLVHARKMAKDLRLQLNQPVPDRDVLYDQFRALCEVIEDDSPVP